MEAAILGLKMPNLTKLCDYWDALTDDERGWLEKFNSEWHNDRRYYAYQNDFCNTSHKKIIAHHSEPYHNTQSSYELQDYVGYDNETYWWVRIPR